MRNTFFFKCFCKCYHAFNILYFCLLDYHSIKSASSSGHPHNNNHADYVVIKAFYIYKFFNRYFSNEKHLFKFFWIVDGILKNFYSKSFEWKLLENPSLIYFLDSIKFIDTCYFLFIHFIMFFYKCFFSTLFFLMTKKMNEHRRKHRGIVRSHKVLQSDFIPPYTT